MLHGLLPSSSQFSSQRRKRRPREKEPGQGTQGVHARMGQTPARLLEPMHAVSWCSQTPHTYPTLQKVDGRWVICPEQLEGPGPEKGSHLASVPIPDTQCG
jgi:hypothetical protein